MDWSLALCLTAVTWLDALYRVPHDAIVFRKFFGRNWTVVGQPTNAARDRTIFRWTPITVSLVLRMTDEDADPRKRRSKHAERILKGRLARCRCATLLLRTLGWCEFTLLVIGIPVLTARYGSWGLRAGLVAVLAMTFDIYVVTSMTLMRLQLPFRRALRRAAPTLSPFSAPRGFEIVREEAITVVPRLVALRYVMGDARFSAWIRPWAYDALHTASPADLSTLTAEALAGIDRGALTSIVSVRPCGLNPDESYCPRCATAYRAGVAACEQCDGIDLITVST